VPLRVSSSHRASNLRRTRTSRANQFLLSTDDRESGERLLEDDRALPPVFVIDEGSYQANSFSRYDESTAQFAITLVEGKWRVPILRHLQGGPLHFGELKRRLSPVSKKVLNQHLRLMVTDGLIVRTDYAGKVPRVEYSLTNPRGHAVLRLLEMVAEWGDRHCRQMKCEESAFAPKG